MIYDWFQTESHLAKCYTFADLMSLRYPGDHKLREYLFQWDHIMDQLQEPLSDNCKRDIMKTHLEHSKVLAPDLAHFNRRGNNDADYTYTFLRGCIQRYLDNQHQQDVLKRRQSALRAGCEKLLCS